MDVNQKMQQHLSNLAPVSSTLEDHVGTVVLRRPPHNYFDTATLTALANEVQALCAQEECRAIVLAAQGRSFCAGANLSFSDDTPETPEVHDPRPLYAEGLRLFSATKPLVAAVHGPAIGGGLGLALVADFRVTCREARFVANFARLGFHCGFGISHTLPRLIGPQRANQMLLTGRAVDGAEAVHIGLADELVEQADVLRRAQAWAAEIAACAPRAVQSMRSTLRGQLLADLKIALEHETKEQLVHFMSADFREGVAAASTRRSPHFAGR